MAESPEHPDQYKEAQFCKDECQRCGRLIGPQELFYGDPWGPGHLCQQCWMYRALSGSGTRTFESGATRDTAVGKFNYEGFESPLVMKRFAAYMHEHRKQKDGTLRSGDNWQRGIPKDAYMDSLVRHLMDVWLHHRGFGQEATESLETALCGLRFNVNGYLFEVLKEQRHA